MRCGTCEQEYVDDGTIRYRSDRLENFSDHIIGLGDKECHYCGREAVAIIQVVPGNRGGCECVENLVAACPFCWNSRGDRLHAEWHAWLMRQAPGRMKRKREEMFLDRVVQILWHWDRT